MYTYKLMVGVYCIPLDIIYVTFSTQISLEVVSRSSALMTPSVFQNLKHRFKVQRLNESLFAIKINLKKKNKKSIQHINIQT